MVKPGGTGRPRLLISARLAPLPPRRSRMSARPSALPSPKAYTHLPLTGRAALPLAGRAAARLTARGLTALVLAFAFDLVGALRVFAAALARIFAAVGIALVLRATFSPRSARSLRPDPWSPGFATGGAGGFRAAPDRRC